MRFGIIGFPQTGKRTVFRLLTGAGETTQIGIGRVRDPRLDTLDQMFKPKKKTPAEIELNLFPALDPGRPVPDHWLAKLREMDAVCHVVRCFDSPSVFHVLETVDPARDVESVTTDLLLTDLVIATARKERLEKETRKGLAKEQEAALALITRCVEALENEKPLSSLDLKPDEEKKLRGFQFLSMKPMLIVLNGSTAEPPKIPLAENAEQVFLNAAEELEIEALEDDAERAEFLESIGVTEPAIDRLSRQAFHLLGLISFFTVGEDEVRAWAIPKNTRAPQAAGAIHSDFERGFIRAEVITYPHLIEAGSEHKAKEAGNAGLKGKDYTVQDGDVIHFLFNV